MSPLRTAIGFWGDPSSIVVGNFFSEWNCKLMEYINK